MSKLTDAELDILFERLRAHTAVRADPFLRRVLLERAADPPQSSIVRVLAVATLASAVTVLAIAVMPALVTSIALAWWVVLLAGGGFALVRALA
jgi:hypothetical protein